MSRTAQISLMPHRTVTVAERVCEKRLALVVLLYNEKANPAVHFGERLRYYQALAACHQAQCNLYLVDDGSTDGSRQEIEHFLQVHPASFQLIAFRTNQQKIGALRGALAELPHPYILCTDFDTDLIGVEHLVSVIERLEQRPDYMGCAFDIRPHPDDTGLWVNYYRLTFHLAGTENLSLQDEDAVTNMLGAASLYRREVLQTILAQHSGRFCGDDLEMVVIGLRLGYKALHEPKIQALTHVPQNYWTIHRQMCCWKRGRLEVMLQERRFFADQILTWTGVGQGALAELGYMFLHLTLPFVLIGLSVINWLYAVVLLMLVYLIAAPVTYWLCLRVSLNEQTQHSDMRSLRSIIPIFPLLWLLLESPAWVHTMIRWGTEKIVRRIKSTRPHLVDSNK